MKVKNDNVLWLHNPGTSDVSISDLGVKVPAGKAVNVFHVNPYLTLTQVETSRAKGALSKRLGSNVLRVINKKVDPKPHNLDTLKESEGTVQAKKTKTSVVIETKTDEPEEGESFEFADYGINDLGPDVDTKKEEGSVYVHAKQDEDTEPDKGAPLEPTVESGVSNQSQVVMKHLQESMTDPTGPLADATVPSQSQPFTVIKPPKNPEEAEAEATSPTGQPVTKDESGAVVVGAEKKPRSIKTVKKSQEEGTSEDVPGDDEVGTDEVIDFEDTEFDTKAAVKTPDGSVIMKIKEDEEADE